MKKIILASGSAQRKNLLKLLNIPFTVKRSTVDEIQEITTTAAALVKENALLKAQDIAAKSKSGIIIGSDTVVVGGNKELLLKPKDLKDARRILKVLFSKPAWVYTGVALIDVKTKKSLVASEKTKIFMNSLTDKEMKKYHKRVPPMDKAGGFDIEGLGSVFIPRIEGCYTNVIGLPMAKLRIMLKKMGVSVLSLLMVISISGCHTEFNLATDRQEYYLHNTDKEIKMGEKVANKFEEKFDVFEGVEENERVQIILDKIVKVSDRRDIVYFIKILDEDYINAVALPGGYIYLFKGIIDHAENDDQLAGIIAHEVAHITAKHALRRVRNSYGAILLQLAAIETGGGAAVNLALTSLFTEYSQRDEIEADKLGVKYMTKAGYDPLQMASFLQIMDDEHSKKGPRQFTYWRTHPHIPERIATVNREVKGELEFRDYIRLIDDEEFNEDGW